MTLLELFDSPEKWTKRTLARDRSRKHVYPTDRRAISWCLVGGMMKVVDYDMRSDKAYEQYCQMTERVQIAQTKLFPQFPDVVEFNNSPKTTFEDIRAVIIEAGV